MWFILSVLDLKYHLRVNLVQKIKIICLNWNSVPRLIWICRIQWLGTFNFSWTRNTLFGLIWFKKIKIVSLSRNFVLRLIPIPDFRVSMAILNLVDISCRCCKLNFGPMRGHVKSGNFCQGIAAVRRQYFHFL